MKVKTILIITFFAFIYGQPQDCSDGRYINEIFDVSIDYGIEYGENTNQALFGQDITETLYMDIYSPSDDDFNSRPLIFFMFGGSFIGGSRLSPDIVALCNKYDHERPDYKVYVKRMDDRKTADELEQIEITKEFEKIEKERAEEEAEAFSLKMKNMEWGNHK